MLTTQPKATPIEARILRICVCVAAGLPWVNATAESWRETPGGRSPDGRLSFIDFDSISGAYPRLRFLTRDADRRGVLFDFSTRMVEVDCSSETRRDSLQYAGAPTGDFLPASDFGPTFHRELLAVCESVRALHAAPTPPVAAPIDSQGFVAASKDGSRRILYSSLKMQRPRVFYRLRYGELNNTTARMWGSDWNDNNVEVDCDQRTRRDVLARGAGVPSGPFISVDSWGAAFVEEIDYVCAWAAAQWQGGQSAGASPAPSTRVPRLSPAPSPDPAPPVAAANPPPPLPPPAQSRRIESTGSGFMVSPTRVVTNHHVVAECSTIAVKQGEQVSSARVAASTQQGDLALLALQSPLGASAAVRSSAALGEDVMVAGFPLHGLLSNDLTVTSGQVNSLAGVGNDPTRLQVSAPVQPGNSGGPLVDQAGAVVGVVVSKLDVERVAKLTGDIAQNVNFAIKPEMLRLFLDTNRVQYQTAQFGKRIERVDLAEKARRFTVQILCVN